MKKDNAGDTKNIKSLKRDGTGKMEMEHRKIQGWGKKQHLAALKTTPFGSFQAANGKQPQRTDFKDKTRSLERPQMKAALRLPPIASHAWPPDSKDF